MPLTNGSLHFHPVPEDDDDDDYNDADDLGDAHDEHVESRDTDRMLQLNKICKYTLHLLFYVCMCLVAIKLNPSSVFHEMMNA